MTAGRCFAGAVVTDGSLGKAQSIAGPNFSVPSTLGQQSGKNLFQSFSTFNLDNGETATFSGPSSVANVISRVTGGSSNINGTIQCTIPGANFYLINPAGVVFGPNAQLNANGSFVVTTASYLKFSDGVQFSAAKPLGAVLSSAAPAAFGFLNSSPAGITLNGSALAGPNGKTISLVGGPIQIVGGVITTIGGRVNLVSTASTGELAFDAVSLMANIDLTPAPATLGDIMITQNSVIQTDGPAGGRISIRGNNLTLSQSLLSASTTDSNVGLGIDIVLSGNLQILDSLIATDSMGAGKAGPISITANQISMDAQGDTQNATGISALAKAGAGGDIVINATSLSVANGGTITVDTASTGNAGTITINSGTTTVDPGTSGQVTGIFARSNTGATGAAGAISISGNSLTINGGGQVSVDTSTSGSAGSINAAVSQIVIDGKGIDRTQSADPLAGTGLFARTDSTAASPGAAGSVQVTAQSLNIVNGGAISSESLGNGQAGSVSISGGTVVIDDMHNNILTGIFADSTSATAGPGGGKITFSVQSLELDNGAFVSASASGAANAGSININASTSLTLNETATGSGTIISTSTFSSGNAGTINITTGALSLTVNSLITSTTQAQGKAGTIAINAQSMTVNGGGVLVESVPSTSSLPSGATPGDAGVIQMTLGTLSLTNGGVINAGSSGAGRGGSISITASSITADGSGTTNNTGIFADSSVNSSVGNGAGDAGTISITGGSISLSNGALISASTAGAGTGGDININLTGALNINGGTTTMLTGVATNAMAQGAAGMIVVKADSIMMQNSGSISSSGAGSGAAGSVNVTANSVTILTGAAISSDTSGTGLGGDVSVTVAGALTINGQDQVAFTGISADTLSSGAGGHAGMVNVAAGSIAISNTGRIASNTLGLGDGGDVNVSASTIVLNESPANRFTGISALSSSTGAGGQGGDVTVNATTSLQITNGARISSETMGQGNGGSVFVTAGALSISNPGDQLNAGIVADTSYAGVGGKAGDVFVTANTLNVSSTGVISSGTFGGGAGGNVTIHAQGIVLDASGANPATIAQFGQSQTGVSTSSQANGAGGAAGNVTIVADSIQLLHGAQVNSATFNTGAGGSVAITTNTLVVAGQQGSGATAAPSTIGATSESTGAGGDGGSVSITAGAVGIFDGAQISTRTASTGRAGDVMLAAQTLQIDNGSGLLSSSAGAGPAGLLTVNLAQLLSITRNSTITTAASSSSGGGIVLTAGRSISLSGNSSITAQAGGEGGTISIRCPGNIILIDSEILTRAGGNGGDMLVDPSFVILQDSVLSANGGNNGGNITVNPNFLFQSQSSITATGARGVSGQVIITPQYDVTGALASLPGQLSDSLTLQPSCAADLPGLVSSFIVTGRGATPILPGGWMPSLDLTPRKHPDRH